MPALSPAAMAKIESTVSDESGVASSPLDVKSTWQLGVNRSITKSSTRCPRREGRMPSLPRRRRVHTPAPAVSPLVAREVTERQVNHSATWQIWLKISGARPAVGSAARAAPVPRRAPVRPHAASVRPRVRLAVPCVVRPAQQHPAGDGDADQARARAQGAQEGRAADQQHHGDQRAAEGAPAGHVGGRVRNTAVPAAAWGAVAPSLAVSGERHRQPAAAVA